MYTGRRDSRDTISMGIKVNINLIISRIPNKKYVYVIKSFCLILATEKSGDIKQKNVELHKLTVCSMQIPPA